MADAAARLTSTLRLGSTELTEVRPEGSSPKSSVGFLSGWNCLLHLGGWRAIPVVAVVPRRLILLSRPILLDDTSSMIDFEHIDWSGNSHLKRLLQTYCDLHEAAREKQAEFDGWLPRIKSLDGVEAGELPSLHGKLIALGFLKFQLVNRTSGMHYHVDPAGREALAHPDGVIADMYSSDDPTDETDTRAAA